MTTAEPLTRVSNESAAAPTDPNGPTGRLATWLAGMKIEDVPSTVREHAKYLLLDGIACALVGAQLPVSRKGVEAVTALDNAGTSLLIGWDGRATSAPSAAMLNSSFIQGFELDDYHPLAPLHSNALVVPAMLAVIPHVKPVSGPRFLLGAILGYETGPRVGLALGGLEMISPGWHSGVVFGDHYEVKVDGAWMPVPSNKINNVIAPDGGAHVCAPKQEGVNKGVLFCVILPPDG